MTATVMVEMKLLGEKCLQSVSWDDFHFQQHLQVQQPATMQGKTPTHYGWMFDMFRRSDPKVGCVFPVVEVLYVPMRNSDQMTTWKTTNTFLKKLRWFSPSLDFILHWFLSRDEVSGKKDKVKWNINKRKMNLNEPWATIHCHINW